MLNSIHEISGKGFWKLFYNNIIYKGKIKSDPHFLYTQNQIKVVT